MAAISKVSPCVCLVLTIQSESQQRVKTYTPPENPFKRHKAEAEKVGGIKCPLSMELCILFLSCFIYIYIYIYI
jgi:hypothetical protein